MTTGAAEPGVLETRYVPWLVRFRRTGRGGAELRLECVDDEHDPRASTAALDGLKVASRGVFFETAELARELGMESAPDSDAELILHAYRRWGRDGIRRLRGIFDVFIWDAKRECLLAARDHLGAEPLFYTRAGDEFLFAASPKTLLTQPGVPRAPNRAVLVETLYWHFPLPEETALDGIRRILPGHVLTITNGTTTSGRYWDPFDDLQQQGWVEADELDEFDQLLERSVSQCLELGPCGIFLSGGLDSVSIAAVALDLAKHRQVPTPWALSLAFPTPESSEEGIQRGVAASLGLPQIMLDLEKSVAPDGLVRRALDLSGDWPMPRTYLWSGAYQALAGSGAENGIRVVMTGAGGDEWLTVDLRLAADFIQALQFRNLYRFARSRIGSFSVPTTSALRYVLWEYGLREVLYARARTLLQRHAPERLRARRRRAFARAEHAWIATDPDLRANVRHRREAELAREIERPTVGGRFHFYASDGAMVLDHPVISAQREDDYEAGSRAGVELLHPYWEPDLISFLYRVPPELLLRGGREKGLVRGTIARRFPTFGFEQQKKVVSADYHYVVIRKEGPEAFRRLGGCTALDELGVVDRTHTDTLMAAALEGTDFHQLHRAWTLANLETWVRQLV